MTQLADTHPDQDRAVRRPVAIEVAPSIVLNGNLRVPAGIDARGTVLFAHSPGSQRHGLRNRSMAGALSGAGFATLLCDLLTRQERSDRTRAVDVELLAPRLVTVTRWLGDLPETGGPAVGYLGADTRAAAALLAAAELRTDVSAVVSWGAAPGVAAARLLEVVAPVLLIVGCEAEDLERGLDTQRRLRCANDLAIVPGATASLEAWGPLQRVTRLTTDWFRRHLSERAVPPESSLQTRNAARSLDWSGSIGARRG